MSSDNFPFRFKSACFFCGEKCGRAVSASDPHRYDEANILASCPRGKAWDLACNEIAEAFWAISIRKNATRPNDDKPSNHDGWEGY